MMDFDTLISSVVRTDTQAGWGQCGTTGPAHREGSWRLFRKRYILRHCRLQLATDGAEPPFMTYMTLANRYSIALIGAT